MEIQSLGGNVVRINTKKTSIIVNDQSNNDKSNIKDGDIVIFSQKINADSDKKVKLIISSAGEYEVADVLVIGLPAFPYKEDGQKKLSSTVYKLVSDDTTVAIIGNVSADLTDEQIEGLGHIDALVVPVGGHDETLDATKALRIIKKIDPFVVIPVHYNDGVTKYGYEQDSLDDAIKIIGLEVSETTNKFKWLRVAKFNPMGESQNQCNRLFYLVYFVD